MPLASRLVNTGCISSSRLSASGCGKGFRFQILEWTVWKELNPEPWTPNPRERTALTASGLPNAETNQAGDRHRAEMSPPGSRWPLPGTRRWNSAPRNDPLATYQHRPALGTNGGRWGIARSRRPLARLPWPCGPRKALLSAASHKRWQPTVELEGCPHRAAKIQRYVVRPDADDKNLE